MRLKGSDSIGKRIREIRKSLKMSQMALAERLDVSYQQVQKYENGKNMISVPRLKQIADVFGVPVHTFIDAEYGVSDYRGTDFFSDDELKLINQFRRLKSRNQRNGFIDMLGEMIKVSKEE